MNRKVLNACFLFFLVLVCNSLYSQERYSSPIFDEVKVTSDHKYGVNISILPALFGGDPAPEDLLMDVYEPVGDTATARPVIILAHLGDFLPPIVNQSPYGYKTDSAIVEFCTRFAKRGFVAVAIDYRVGWNPFGSALDAKRTVLQAVYRITQDMRTAVRFFRQDATAFSNQFRIDTGRFAVGGFDAAGWAAQSVANLKSGDQTLLPKFLDLGTQPPTPFIWEPVFGDPYGVNGGQFSLANYSEYSSEVDVVINIEGGLGDFSWLQPGDVPVIAFQAANKFNNNGIRDVTIAVGGTIIIADGAFPDTIIHQSQALGNQDVFLNAGFDDDLTQTAMERSGGLEGLFLYMSQRDTGSVQCDNTAGVPPVGFGGNTYSWDWYDETWFAAAWDGAGQNPASAQKICEYNTSQGNPNDPAISRMMIDTFEWYMVPRIMAAMGLTSGTSSIPTLAKEDVGFKAFPNPAIHSIRFTAKDPIKGYEIYNLSGQLIKTNNNVNNNIASVKLSNIPEGLYLAKVTFEKGVITEKIMVTK